jgi:hypothetical protein
MASIFYLPKVTSLPGAKLYFSISTTSTPQEVYTSSSLNTAHPDPLEADAAGVFPPIYLDPTFPDYRVALYTSADVLVYQVDGYPSNQNVQQSMRLESTNPFLFLFDTDGSTGLRKYRIRAAGGAFEVQASNEAESSFQTILRYEGNILYSNETEVAVVKTGDFTGTLTGVSGTISADMSYRIVSDVVTLYFNNSSTGTSNSTSMTITGLPVAVRPSIARAVPVVDVVDNGNVMCQARAVVESSTITFYLARTDLTTNYVRHGATSFTGSGTKGIESTAVITYPL